MQLDEIRLPVTSPCSGPLVLFSHGWPQSWYSWRHQMAAVVASVRCDSDERQ